MIFSIIPSNISTAMTSFSGLPNTFGPILVRTSRSCFARSAINLDGCVAWMKMDLDRFLEIEIPSDNYLISYHISGWQVHVVQKHQKIQQ
jgi:hypothetical protein